MSKENEAVILSAARTAIGKFQGGLSSIPAVKLGAVAVKAAVERAGIDPKEIEEVLMGNVVQAGNGQAPARQAAIFAGLPATVGATAVNKVCGLGLKAAMMAAQAVRAGDADVDATAAAAQRRRLDPRVFQRFPAHFEQHALLRVHQCGFAWGNAKECRVKSGDIADRASGEGVACSRVIASGMNESVQRPALWIDFRHQIPAVQKVLPILAGACSRHSERIAGDGHTPGH